MSTIAGTAETADSIDYWVPCQSEGKHKPPWDRRVMLSAIGQCLRTSTPSRPRFPRSSLHSSNNSKRRNRKSYNRINQMGFCGH
jgi:hypothetical protein